MLRLEYKKISQIISQSLIILVGEEGLSSKGCKIVRGRTGGVREEYILAGYLIDLLQVWQSVFEGWGEVSFLLSTETSVRFI